MLLIDFRFGQLRGWKGPTLRALSSVMERFSGHYSGSRPQGGVPWVVGRVGLTIEREKIRGRWERRYLCGGAETATSLVRETPEPAQCFYVRMEGLSEAGTIG